MGNTKDFYKMFDQPIEVRSYPIKVPIPPELLSSLLLDERDQFKATDVPGLSPESGTGTPSWMFNPAGTPIDPNQYRTLPYSIPQECNINDRIDDNARIVDSILISKMKIAMHDIEKAIIVAQSGKGDYRSYIERAIAWLEDL